MQACDILTAIDDIVATWTPERDERMQRRHLDPADFAALADSGFLRLTVPCGHGGLWASLAETGPVVVEAIRRLARADQSVALVASMHPSMLMFWTGAPDAPPEYATAWREQRSAVFASACDGHFWGTITSEPGSGGDMLKTKTRAVPVEGSDRVALFGQKHFGSGSEVVSYMVTTAREAGADQPVGCVLDLRDQPWDGTGGLTITQRWDGVGMKATQSHAVLFEGVEAMPFAWPGSVVEAFPPVAALGLSLFVAVIASVIDSTMAEAASRLTGRELRAYEDVEWSRAEIEHWLLTQAVDGLGHTMVSAPAAEVAAAAIKAKMAVAELAETLVARVCRVVGGGAFSATSPFATWYEDVRALGYLRPPWALAFDQISAARRVD